MYKILVPNTNANVKRRDRERLLREIKRYNAERVFLSMEAYMTDEKKRQKILGDLKDNCKYLKENGYEVGAWFWTFLFKNNTDYTNMRTIKGVELKDIICPTDENFVKFAAEFVSDVAKCGVDLIQFDDDFRFGFVSDSPACLCDRHIKIINDITGENSTREELEKHITSGGKNKYRDAYLKTNGDALRNFARTIREAVDKVNPDIRVGYCSCMTNWDIDGTHPYEIAKLLAGNTKPFVRLIGAPYWAACNAWGNNLQDVIELERMESAWTKHDDIEVFAEGDVFPRPRVNCPASYLEGFDTAIRASGCTDGILKYGLDCFTDAEYDTGYARYHERNIPLYEQIDKTFSDKKSCGIRVYESMKKLSDMVMPTKVNTSINIEDMFFSKAARTLACNSIPTVYEGEGVCGIVFDENARNLPLSALKNGLILDLAAAEILTERGVDVGLKDIVSTLDNSKDLKVIKDEEHFVNTNDFIYAISAETYNIKVKENVEVLSYIETSGGDIPLSYRYENADGFRFLVLNINTRAKNQFSVMLKHIERGRQIARNVSWLSGKKLPAYTFGHPSLYIQCKKDGDAQAVGLWNFFADTAIEPVVELDDNYKSIKFINCNGRLENDKVYLSDIAPFAFAGFEVIK